MAYTFSGPSMVFLVYDGIGNSVFHSQVVTPLKRRLHKDLRITIVSFERNKISEEKIKAITSQGIHLVIFKKYRFMGKLSLWLASRQFSCYLKKEHPSSVVARGPLAGWIAQKSFSPVMIQARGLAAEEHRYTASRVRHGLLKRMMNGFFYRSYKKIEQEVYGNKFLQIEAVSNALRQYLIDHFAADGKNIFIAENDIPDMVDKAQIAAWRGEVRKELGIPIDQYVYTYMGSARPWQCIDEMVTYAATTDDKAYFLFLSEDRDEIVKKLKAAGVPSGRYGVVTCKPDETYRYLSATDAGLLFREKDVVNWVSRPTKVLEYRAVGLKIIHNNTVEMLLSE